MVRTPAGNTTYKHFNFVAAKPLVNITLLDVSDTLLCWLFDFRVFYLKYNQNLWTSVLSLFPIFGYFDPVFSVLKNSGPVLGLLLEFHFGRFVKVFVVHNQKVAHNSS